jgi:hypothetical protein
MKLKKLIGKVRDYSKSPTTQNKSTTHSIKTTPPEYRKNQDKKEVLIAAMDKRRKDHNGKFSNPTHFWEFFFQEMRRQMNNF